MIPFITQPCHILMITCNSRASRYRRVLILLREDACIFQIKNNTLPLPLGPVRWVGASGLGDSRQTWADHTPPVVWMTH